MTLAATTGSSTRDAIVASARELLLVKGYAGTTVDEICAHAKVSKGSFYHSFSSKEEVGLAALEAFFQDGNVVVGEGLRSLEGSPRERALGFVQFLEENAERWWSRGCLLGTFALELAETNSALRARVAGMFRRLEETIGSILQPALRPDAPVTGVELASQLLGSIEGGIVLAKAADDMSKIRQSVRHFRRYFETLI